METILKLHLSDIQSNYLCGRRSHLDEMELERGGVPPPQSDSCKLRGKKEEEKEKKTEEEALDAHWQKKNDQVHQKWKRSAATLGSSHASTAVALIARN